MYPVNLNQQKSKIDFQARQAASVITNVNNIRKEIKLYELDKSDLDFAKKMLAKIDLQKLYPNLDDYTGFSEWKTLIKHAVNSIGTSDVILAVENKRPCGILAFYDQKINHTVVSRFATWYNKPETKVTHIGKALMRRVFQHAQEYNIDTIITRPANCTPRGKSCKNFYRAVGFEMPNAQYPEHWHLSNKNFAVKCAQLDNFFQYKKIDKAPDVDLNSELCLKFEDTLLEKAQAIFKGLFK